MKTQNQIKEVSKQTLCSSIATLVEQGKTTITLQDIASIMNTNLELIKKNEEFMDLYNFLVKEPLFITYIYWEYKLNKLQPNFSSLESYIQQYFHKKECDKISFSGNHHTSYNDAYSHNYNYESDDDYHYRSYISDPWESIHEQQDKEDQERFESAVNDFYDLLDTITNGFD